MNIQIDRSVYELVAKYAYPACISDMHILHIGEGKICCENLGYGKWVWLNWPEVEYQSIIFQGNNAQH